MKNFESFFYITKFSLKMEELKGTYDLIIAGTGLTESLISGCCAEAGKKLINFDKSREYGGFLKTKGIHDFVNWAKENGEIYVNNVEKKLTSKVRNGAFAIDLFPIVVFSRDKIIDVLNNTKNFQNLLVYLLEGLYFRTKDCFRLIPSSRSTIFSDSNISLRQKRNVTKFISYFLPAEEYGHKIDTSDIQAKVENYQDKPFKDLLKALSFDDDLSGAFEYFIASANKPLLTSEAVPRIRTFLSSFGRWGPTPFVEFAYGASESPQIFARHSAVFGGIFVLDHYPQKIERDEATDELILNVDDIGEIRTKHYIASPEHLEGTGEKKLIAHREVLLLNRKLIDSDRSVAVIAPGIYGNTHPIYVLQFDSVLRACIEDQYLIHISSMGEVHDTVLKLLEEARTASMKEKEELRQKRAKEAAEAAEKAKAEKERQEAEAAKQAEEAKQTSEDKTAETPEPAENGEAPQSTEATNPAESNENENKKDEQKNENTNENAAEPEPEIDDPDDFIILHAAFTLFENIPKQVKGVIPVISPSLDELVFGTNYFIESALEIVQNVFPDVQFYPKPTEVEINIEDDPEQNEEPKQEATENTQEGKQEETPASTETSSPEESKKDEEKQTE